MKKMCVLIVLAVLGAPFTQSAFATAPMGDPPSSNTRAANDSMLLTRDAHPTTGAAAKLDIPPPDTPPSAQPEEGTGVETLKEGLRRALSWSSLTLGAPT